MTAPTDPHHAHGAGLDTLLGGTVLRSVPLGHGTSGAGTVLVRHILADGRDVVTKTLPGAAAAGGLAVEGRMLRYLAAHSGLPVPHVWHADDRLLVMDYLPGGGPLSGQAADEAADALAALHGVGADAYGFAEDTVIGPLRQPNPWEESWHTFFARHRLLHMAGECVAAGRAGQDLLGLTERVCARLEALVPSPNPPGLVHGDLWGGNVLSAQGRLSGFVDPALYYGDPEMDLAFGTLFGTLSPRFFARYEEHRPLAPGFFEVRRDLYNLWPLLVHVRLFGGGYLAQAESILRRFGE